MPKNTMVAEYYSLQARRLGCGTRYILGFLANVALMNPRCPICDRHGDYPVKAYLSL